MTATSSSKNSGRRHSTSVVSLSSKNQPPTPLLNQPEQSNNPQEVISPAPFFSHTISDPRRRSMSGLCSSNNSVFRLPPPFFSKSSNSLFAQKINADLSYSPEISSLSTAQKPTHTTGPSFFSPHKPLAKEAPVKQTTVKSEKTNRPPTPNSRPPTPKSRPTTPKERPPTPKETKPKPNQKRTRTPSPKPVTKNQFFNPQNPSNPNSAANLNSTPTSYKPLESYPPGPHFVNPNQMGLHFVQHNLPPYFNSQNLSPDVPPMKYHPPHFHHPNYPQAYSLYPGFNYPNSLYTNDMSEVNYNPSVQNYLSNTSNHINNTDSDFSYPSHIHASTPQNYPESSKTAPTNQNYSHSNSSLNLTPNPSNQRYHPNNTPSQSYNNPNTTSSNQNYNIPTNQNYNHSDTQTLNQSFNKPKHTPSNSYNNSNNTPPNIRYNNSKNTSHQSFNTPTNQSFNIPTNQSFNSSTNQSFNSSTNQSFNHSNNTSTNQSFNTPTNHSFDHSNNTSTNQSFNNSKTEDYPDENNSYQRSKSTQQNANVNPGNQEHYQTILYRGSNSADTDAFVHSPAHFFHSENSAHHNSNIPASQPATNATIFGSNPYNAQPTSHPADTIYNLISQSSGKKIQSNVQEFSKQLTELTKSSPNILQSLISKPYDTTIAKKYKSEDSN